MRGPPTDHRVRTSGITGDRRRPFVATFLGAVLLWSPLDTELNMHNACQLELSGKNQSFQ